MLKEVTHSAPRSRSQSPCPLERLYHPPTQKAEETPKPINFHDLFDDAKLAERKNLHNALGNAFHKFFEKHFLKNDDSILQYKHFPDQHFPEDGASTLQPISLDQLKKDFHHKIERLFVLLFISEGNLTLQSAIEETKRLKLEETRWICPKKCPDSIAKIKQLATENHILPASETSFFHRYLKELPNEIKFLQDETAYEREVNELRSEVGNMQAEFKRNLDIGNDNLEISNNYRKSIDKIFESLRQLMNHNIYQINKSNENHLLTQFVHELSFAGYHDTLVSQNFESFGKKVLEITKVSPGLPLGEKIEKAWKTLRDRGIPSNMVGAHNNFTLKERGYLVGEYASYGMESINLKSLESHDERKFPDNIPGSLYEEECEVIWNKEKVDCRIRTVYTCNPTIGFNVAPEYLAVLQGMENRFFYEIQNDAYPYHAWNYTNLQNFSSRLEKHHAKILMGLNEEFPLSFKGITVTQNSPFFATQPDIFNEKYRDALLRELLLPDNFTLKNRFKNHGGLYYFPSKDREHWEQVLPGIVSLAYKTITQQRHQQTEQELAAAFKELTHLGIIRHSQQLILGELKRLTGRTAISIMDNYSCKADIDRGGKTTAEQFIARSTEAEDTLALGAFLGRPILTARRLLLEEHTLPFYDFMKVVSRDVIKKFFAAVGETVSGKSSLIARSFRVLTA